MEIASANDYGPAALIELSTSKLLRRMVTENRTLEPAIGGDGRVHYPFAEDVLREEGVPEPEVAVRTWIADMVGAGILHASSVMEVAMCPIHLRADPLVQLQCANCGSRSTRKASLMEHIYCGFMSDDRRFKKEGVLRCPNCQRLIVSADDLRVSGVWYECPTCLLKASSPNVVFVCREKHDFTTGDAVLTPIHTYTVVESMTSELKNTLVLDPLLADMLKSLGYTVSYPATVKGQSGATHKLDMYGRKDGEDIALQIAVDSKPVEAAAVMALFSKTYDIKPKFAILIAIPSASESAKRVNAGYAIFLVEDSDGSGVVQKVRTLLEKETTQRRED